MSHEWGYLAVADWPSGWSTAQRAVAVVAAAGLDPADAERRVLRDPPMLLARMPAVAARAAEQALGSMGVTALAISTTQIARAPQPIRARRMVAGPALAYTVDLWRGPPLTLNMSEVWLLIRAKLTKVTLGQIDAQADVWVDDPRGWGMEGAAVRDRELVTRDLIEIWRRDGSRIRIDGSKFSYEVLGAQRAASDAVNADRLALVLAGAVPQAMVDAGFRGLPGAGMLIRADFPRPAIDRQRFPDDDLGFEFYSVWLAALYRRLLGGGTAHSPPP